MTFRAHFVQFHWDFIAMFRIVDTFFTINLQTFEGRNSEVHFARQKQCFGEHLCARLQPQRFFSRFPYKTAAKTTKMNPKKNNTKEPEGTRGELHHPNIIEKSEPLTASEVREESQRKKTFRTTEIKLTRDPQQTH